MQEVAVISPQYSEPTRRTHMNTVTCVICQATYAPSQLHEYLLLAPPVALESAFMSMCHFCFRCRRPACPQCWDDVHGVCGACSQEAQLSFRVPSTPLHGLLFPPARQTRGKRDEHEAFPLVCVHYGRFQHVAREKEQKQNPPLLSPSPQLASQEQSSEQATAHMRSVTTQAFVPAVVPFPERISRMRTRPEHTFNLEEIDTRPVPSDVEEIDTLPPQKTATPRRSIWRRIEHVLTFLVVALVIIIMIMILLSLFFPGANAFLLGTLHVDIQTEVAYLLQLITHLL